LGMAQNLLISWHHHVIFLAILNGQIISEDTPKSSNQWLFFESGKTSFLMSFVFESTFSTVNLRAKHTSHPYMMAVLVPVININLGF
jgi:hypothetical protein